MRWTTYVALGLLAGAAVGQTGCSTLSGGPFRSADPSAGAGPTGSSSAGSSPAASSSAAAPNSTPGGAPAAGDAVARASYIEQRYREEFDPIKRPSASGLDALKPEYIKAQLLDVTGSGPNAAVARERFGQAEAAYAQALNAKDGERAELFTAAAQLYVSAAEKWPESLLEEDALFLAGESFFFADEYPRANEQYEKLIKQHPNTRHIDTVDARRFAIAQFWLEEDRRAPQSFFSVNLFDKAEPWRDTRGHAFRVFDRIRIDDPTGKLSDDATLAAANAYFARGDFFKADQLYTDLRKTFPSSEHQFLAHFLGLKAKLSCYEGPDYAGEVLDQAEQLIKQIRRQFPQQAEQEKEYLVRALAEVRFKKAERIWTMGRYHELRQEYRAAQFYYDQVVKDFSDTPFSSDAQERVQSNAGLPAVPPQRFQWLVDLFPQRENAKPLLTSNTPELGSTSTRR